MGVFIKGMEMPKSCWRCTLSQLYEKPRVMLVCKITHEEVLRYKIDSNCPLVEVPTPHGRLIDADAILGKINAIISAHPDEADLYEQDAVIVRDWLRSEPTIIESEGE